MTKSWHIVRVTAGREYAVALSLVGHGIETFCPMQILGSVVRGQFREDYRALFTTYLFARWQTDDPHQWHLIMDTSGVIEILGGSDPKIIKPGVVEDWIERADQRGVIEDLAQTLADLRRGYKLYDEVRLTRGLYNAITGIVVWIDDTTQRVGVKISMLGRIGVIVRKTTECELLVPAPGTTLSRQGHKGGGRRGRRARAEAYAQYWRKILPTI